MKNLIKKLVNYFIEADRKRMIDAIKKAQYKYMKNELGWAEKKIAFIQEYTIIEIYG